MTQCLTKKVPRGCEPRSLDPEFRVLTITPRDQLREASTSFLNLNSPILSCQETHRPQGQLLALLLHFAGSVDRALAFSVLSENLRYEVQRLQVRVLPGSCLSLIPTCPCFYRTRKPKTVSKSLSTPQRLQYSSVKVNFKENYVFRRKEF